MINKPLLSGVAGFLLGGLVVAIAATTFDKPQDSSTAKNTESASSMTMDDMTLSLKNKSGDAYDKAFIAEMIEHHEGAVKMAKLSAGNAEHDEVKKLSSDIISAQEKEITQMKQWQIDWGYSSPTMMDDMHNNMMN